MYPPGTHPVGSTAHPWLGRSLRRPVQPFRGLFSRFASPSQPSADASCRAAGHLSTFRPTAPSTPGCRKPFRLRAAGLRVSPLARRPLSACDPPRPPLPRAEAPSADESLRARPRPRALPSRLSPEQVPHPRAPWFPRATRVSFRLAGFGPRSGTESRRWCHGSKTTRAQLPTCFHESAHAVPLDLPRRAGFSPERSEPHAAHRLLQSGRPTSTPNELPNPAGKCLRSDLSTGSSSLRREEPADLTRTRGRPVLLRRFDPRATTARRTDLPQLVSVSRTPSCRDADASGDWNGSPAATCGCGGVRFCARRRHWVPPLREDPLALACQAEAWPRPRGPRLAVRAACPLRHANVGEVCCTQGAFHRPSSRPSRTGRAQRFEGWRLGRSGFPESSGA